MTDYRYHTRRFSLPAPKLSELSAAGRAFRMTLDGSWPSPESAALRRWAQLRWRHRVAAGLVGARSVQRYEAYGPGGAAILMEGESADRLSTASRLRELLARYGGRLAAQGALAYLFNEVGVLLFPAGAASKGLEHHALSSGAEDVVIHPGGMVEVLADPMEAAKVDRRLREAGFSPAAALIARRSWTRVVLDGAVAVAMLELLDAVQTLTDIQAIYTNAEISDESLARV